MFAKLFVVALIAVYAAAQQHHHHQQGHAASYASSNLHLSHPQLVEFHDKHGHKDFDFHAHPQYQFEYGVKDDHTHDHHSQKEHRDGDKVVGEYTVQEADGTLRTVKYHADKHTGFHAEVIRSGHAAHPAVYGHAGGHREDAAHYYAGHY